MQRRNTKKTIVFILTILLGYVFFILPNIFLGISKWNGGLLGINLLLIGVFQLISIFMLLKWSLKVLDSDFAAIGVTFSHFKNDMLTGIAFGFLWTLLQFVFIIPATGGANRDDVSGMLTMFDGTLTGLFSFIVLGVVGGGIAEELFNRGYFISILRGIFKNETFGLWLSSILSVLFFIIGHLPSDMIELIDILIPTLGYTLLFIITGRLTASIMAHSIYNLLAILLTYYLYYS